MTEISGHHTSAQVFEEQQRPAETELEDVRQRQLQKLIDLGFHDALGVSEADYRNSFPSFPDRLPAYGQILDIPLLVDPRVSLSVQHERGGIRNWRDPEKVSNTTKVPDKPYAIWTHGRLINRTDKLQELSKPQRNALFHAWEASPQVEVTALWLQRADVFEGHGFEAIGSRGVLPHPSLAVFSDDRVPMFKESRTAFSGADWEGLHRGKNINVGK